MLGLLVKKKAPPVPFSQLVGCSARRARECGVCSSNDPRPRVAVYSPPSPPLPRNTLRPAFCCERGTFKRTCLTNHNMAHFGPTVFQCFQAWATATLSYTLSKNGINSENSKKTRIAFDGKKREEKLGRRPFLHP